MAFHCEIKRVLFIDLPTYHVSLPEIHRVLVEKRWRLQVIMWERRVGRKMIRPSLSYSRGILTLAACLEQEGFQAIYLNYSDPADREEVYKIAKRVDVVCITVLTPTLHMVISICNRIKQINPSVVIILGGPHITALPIESLRDCSNADLAMVGECESRLPTLLKSIETPDEISGTVYRDGETIRISSSVIEPVLVSELPLPAYHLLRRPLRHYAHNIKTTRGCPYRCNFCVERLSGNPKSSSQRTIQQVYDELTFLSDRLQPGTLVHFSDAILNIDSNRTRELADRIKIADFDLLYSFDTRVDFVEEEQVEVLSKANFVYFRMGFESIRDNVLRTVEKSTSYYTELEASRIIRSVNDRLAIHAYMVAGLPGCTRETIALDAAHFRKLIERDYVDIIGNKILVPYPGTPYFDNASSMNITIKTSEWSKYDRNSYPVYELKDLSSDEIYFGFLLQEASLTQAYSDRLDGNGASLEDVKSGLDYAYENYAKADDLH